MPEDASCHTKPKASGKGSPVPESLASASEPRFRTSVLRTCVRDCKRGRILAGFVAPWTTVTCWLPGPLPPKLQHVGLAEALELTLLTLAKEPTKFRAAVLRWHARYCCDNKVSIEEATAVLGLLAMLEGGRARPAAQALAGLLDSRTLLPAAEVLVRWANQR